MSLWLFIYHSRNYHTYISDAEFTCGLNKHVVICGVSDCGGEITPCLALLHKYRCKGFPLTCSGMRLAT